MAWLDIVVARADVIVRSSVRMIYLPINCSSLTCVSLSSSLIVDHKDLAFERGSRNLEG